jgi:hypothetical protein
MSGWKATIKRGPPDALIVWWEPAHERAPQGGACAILASGACSAGMLRMTRESHGQGQPGGSGSPSLKSSSASTSNVPTPTDEQRTRNPGP